MSLKSIRNNYTKLLAAFESAGVKLNESQKAELDTFIVALESKIDDMKKATVRATKKVVTEHLDKEYKKVVESILNHKAKNEQLAGKIQAKVNSINESKKLARKVDGYLNMYVESILPEKTVVDYDRMEKLESLHESLKDLLLVNEDAVEAKKEKLQESFKKQKRDYETQIAKLQVKLNESMKKELALNKQIDQSKARDLLESKIKDLPDFEARQMRKRLAEATTVEIQKNFKKILESVKGEIKEDEKVEETSLEEEVNNIIEADEKDGKKKVSEKEVEEDDPLKGRVHNGHLNEKDDEADEVDEDDDVELSEDEKIDESLMAWWCDKVGTIETKGY